MKEVQRAKGPIPASQLCLMCSSQTFLFVIFDHGELNLTDFRRHRLRLRSFIQPGSSLLFAKLCLIRHAA